jgi:hypothetical protein
MKLYKAAHTVYKTKISYCLDNSVSKKDFSNRGKKLSENKTSGNKEILSRLGIYRDRNKERSCSFVYGNPPKVCRKQSNGNHQKEYQ